MTTTQAQSAWPLQKPQQLVYIELGSDNGGMMLGICEQGLTYRAMSPLKADGPVNFTFALDGNTRLQGTGEIVWLEEGGKTGGLKFTAVSPQFRESLREWLASESTPKAVGREVNPAVALPLDSLNELKTEARSNLVEDAKPAAPPRLPEEKPVAPKAVESVHLAAKSIAQIPVEQEAAEPKLIEPERVEQKSPEAKPFRSVQPEELVREIEAHVPPPALPPKVESKPIEEIEEKAQAPRPVEPPPIEPIVPEPELRSVAPLAPAETSSESVFSLPNFHLPLASAPDLPSVSELPPVPHLPMEEIAQSATKTVPMEALPPTPLPEIPWSAPSSGFTEVASHETEIPVLHHERDPQETFSEDFAEESSRLNRAAATGIISLALAVILAALVFSFHREVGEMLIRSGEMLSGEERKLAIAQQPVSSAAPAQNSQPSGAQPSGNADQSAAQPNTAQSPKTTDPSFLQTQDKSSSSQASATTSTQTLAADPSTTTVSPSSSPSTNTVQRIQDLPPSADGGSGQKEFEKARNILKGNHRQRDLSLAVNLLWTGVRKGYVPAEVTLADLYARGDGVARSCAQARELLEAAVQKGSPEARRRLSQLKQQGCS